VRCVQCETEVLVVKGTDAEISCCGQALAPKEG
jgi:ribosomal protein S27E